MPSRIGWVVLGLAPLAGLACGSGGDDFRYSGTPNQPVQANFGSDLLADVAVNVNGGATKHFTVDTGAPFTILSASSFPDHADGSHNDTIQAFALTFPNAPDVSFSIATDGDGIFGGNLLLHFAFTLDYLGNRVWLGDPFNTKLFPGDLHTTGENDVAFDLLGGGRASTGGNCTVGCTVDYPPTRVVVSAHFEGAATPVNILIDSGASVVVIDPALFAALTSDPNRPVLQGVELTGVTGDQTSFLSRVSRIAVGAATPKAEADSIVVGVIPDSDLLKNISQETGRTVQALVGATYLRYFVTTVDYQASQLRLAPYVDPMIDPNEWIGAGFVLGQNSDGSYYAKEVYTNRDAYAQGLRENQIVEAIADQPITGQPGSVVQNLLDTFSKGERMKLTVVVGGSMTTVNVLVEDLLPNYPPPS